MEIGFFKVCHQSMMKSFPLLLYLFHVSIGSRALRKHLEREGPIWANLESDRMNFQSSVLCSSLMWKCGPALIKVAAKNFLAAVRLSVASSSAVFKGN